MEGGACAGSTGGAGAPRSMADLRQTPCTWLVLELTHLLWTRLVSTVQLVIASSDRRCLEALVALESANPQAPGAWPVGAHPAGRRPQAARKAPGSVWKVGAASYSTEVGHKQHTRVAEGHAGPPQSAGASARWDVAPRNVIHLGEACHLHGGRAVLSFGGSEQVPLETVHYLQSVLNHLDRTLLDRLTSVRKRCT